MNYTMLHRTFVRGEKESAWLVTNERQDVFQKYNDRAFIQF